MKRVENEWKGVGGGNQSWVTVICTPVHFINTAFLSFILFGCIALFYFYFLEILKQSPQ